MGNNDRYARADSTHNLGYEPYIIEEENIRELREGDISFQNADRVTVRAAATGHGIIEPVSPMEIPAISAMLNEVVQRPAGPGELTAERIYREHIDEHRAHINNERPTITLSPNPDTSHWARQFMGVDRGRDDAVDSLRYFMTVGGRGRRPRERSDIFGPDHEQFLSETEKRKYLECVNRIARTPRERPEDIWYMRAMDYKVQSLKFQLMLREQAAVAPAPTVIVRDPMAPRHPSPGTPLTKATSKFHALLSIAVRDRESQEIYEHGYPEARLIPSNHTEICESSQQEQLLEAINELLTEVLGEYSNVE